MKVAILSPTNPSSPFILAENLHSRLKGLGISSKVFFCHDLLHRLCDRKKSGKKLHFHVRQRMRHAIQDHQTLSRLSTFDAIVLADYIPTAYNPGYFGIVALRARTNRPVYIYEVYSPHNAPSIEAVIRSRFQSDPVQHFDGILHVASTTEIKGTPYPNSFHIGLESKAWNLAPQSSEKISVLVDFEQPGREKARNMQIQLLEQLGIEHTILEGRYSIEEIRKLYAQSSHYIIQSPEAFGLPICENLNLGTQILTEKAHWPMSWRHGNDIQSFTDGELPNYFHVFENEDGLRNILTHARHHQTLETSEEVRRKFTEDYPAYYHGAEEGMLKWLDSISGF